MSKWLNNKKMLWKRAAKPCHALAFCPYGQLVEEFPIKAKAGAASCEVFGHDCPVFYHAEPMSEDEPKNFVGELNEFYAEMETYITTGEKKAKKEKERVKGKEKKEKK
jgi:hypothetical protein